MKYTKKIIEELSLIKERQLDGEIKAREMIESFLKEKDVDFFIQEYTTAIPKKQVKNGPKNPTKTST